MGRKQRRFPSRAPCRIVRVVIVQLIDGTFELFRYFLSPAAAFDRSAPEELRAVRGVIGSVLGMLEGGATHLGVATDHVVESFRNQLCPATRRARAWTRCSTPSSSRSRMRWRHSAWLSGPWSSSRPTTRWPRRRPWPQPMRGSSRSSCARQTRIWRSACGATTSSSSIGAPASCETSRRCGRSSASRPHRSPTGSPSWATARTATPVCRAGARSPRRRCSPAMGTSGTFRSSPRSGTCPCAERCGWPRRSRSSGSARCCFGSSPRCVRTRPSRLMWTRSAGPDHVLTLRRGQRASGRRRSTNAPRRWRRRAPTLPRSARSLSLELHVLVRRRPRIVGDKAEPRFLDARTHSLQEGQLPDRKDHGLVVDQLLDALEKRRSLLRVELTRLLLAEPVDGGVPPVGVGAARDHERLQPGGRVAEDAAQPVDDVLELLLLIRLEEPRPLERAEPRLDADGLKIVEDRLAAHAGPRTAPEVAAAEALRVPASRTGPPGLAPHVGVHL